MQSHGLGEHTYWQLPYLKSQVILHDTSTSDLPNDHLICLQYVSLMHISES